jgi:hypothetical protein
MIKRLGNPYLISGAILLLLAIPLRSAPALPSDYDVTADFAVINTAGPLDYGTNVWWTDEDAALWIERWTELGPSQVRLPVIHGLIEPENDNSNPNSIDWDGFLFETPITVPVVMSRTFTYRAQFEALRDQPNLDVLIHFSYLAPWLTDNSPHPQLLFSAAPYPPNDLLEYREFVRAVLRYLVEEVGLHPSRISVEAMNEPDLGCGVDPVTPCFWDDWTMADVVAVVRATHEVIQTVDSRIGLIGLAECCGTNIVRDLLDNYPEGAYLDGLSYHYYAGAYDLDQALSRASTLSGYGLPVYLDEYGSRSFLSEGVDGALWHSWALGTLWEAGIAPLQYPISEWVLLGEPYNSMGLFEDWRGGWVRKPSYWVYVDFFSYIGHSQVISLTAPPEIDALAWRRLFGHGFGRAEVVLWLTNRTSITLTNQSLAVLNFVTDTATLRTYDNLVGPSSVQSMTVSGSPLVFTATLPARSSSAFVLSAEGWIWESLFIPLVWRYHS